MKRYRIKTILFDLDGTLLPMEQEGFIKAYFGGMVKKLAPYGYEPQKLIDSIWAGMKDMITNNGEQTNEERFLSRFCSIHGEDAKKALDILEDYYHNEFAEVQRACGYDPQAAETVRHCRELGFAVALATNPVFPPIATENRIRWAGLSPEDFDLITTYGNSTYCKPSLAYYRQVAERAGVAPEECLMVGNDISDDMPAEQLGMSVFLLTNCLIAKEGQSIEAYPHGGFAELNDFLEMLNQ